VSGYPTVAEGERTEGHTEKVRRAEVEAVKPWFDPGYHVLELGGGNGYQAGIIASWGCDVVSIDIPDSPHAEAYYPVQSYDGVSIPYADESFDVVFSCAVLPSIKDLPPVLRETHRVLKPGGLAIHIAPSRTWRLWTSLSHPIWLFKLLLWRPRRSTSHATKASSAAGNSNKPSLFLRVKQALFPGPPTAHSNVLSELYYWSKGHWLTVLEESGFEAKWIGDNGLFYTGKALMPGLSLRTRRVLARFLGPTQYVFVMRKSKAIVRAVIRGAQNI
jgi:SAM-dependent methyltransferase